MNQSFYFFVLSINIFKANYKKKNRKELENKLKIADRFISKFQLKNEELNYLCETENSSLHPVSIIMNSNNLNF